MFKLKSMSGAVSAAVIAAATSAPAALQAQESGGRLIVEEVIVTARKREESLFDVPTAVSAISNEQLETLRLYDARDFLTLVPTAFLQESVAGTSRDINIRGVGTPNLFAESGVATYIDEVYSSGFISYPTQFYDVERIEVLRGPQGALYGRNAVGGAMNVISARPDEELGGSLRATYGRYEREEYEGTLNIPLNHAFRARVTGWYTDQDEGEYFNPEVREYLDANESQGGRLVLDGDATDRLSLTLVAEVTDAESAGTALFFPGDGETQNSVPRDTHPRNDYDTYRISGIANLDTDAGLWTLVLGTREYNLEGVEDTDLTGDNPYNLITGQLGQQITNRENDVESTYVELRWLSPSWGNLSVLAGVNYLDEEATGDVLTNLQTLSDEFSGGALPATLSLENDQTVESIAGFVEATYKFTPSLSAIASLRYTEDDKDVNFTYDPSPLIQSFVGTPQTADTEDTFDQWTPGLTINWEPSEDLRVYGKVQTGFRAGGYNFNVGSVDNLAYDQEESISYEIGTKLRLWDGRAVLGGNIFLLEQEDVLVPLFDFTVPGPLGGFLDNVGEAETWGVEVEGSVAVTDNLNMTFSAGWLDAEFTDGMDSFGNDLEGNDLPAARELTYAFTGSYRRPITESITFFADASYTYRDDGYLDVANNTPVDDAELLNASAGIEYRGLQIWGYWKNALDEDYQTAFGFRPPASTGETRAEGETYGVTLKYSF